MPESRSKLINCANCPKLCTIDSEKDLGELIIKLVGQGLKDINFICDFGKSALENYKKYGHNNF